MTAYNPAIGDHHVKGDSAHATLHDVVIMYLAMMVFGIYAVQSTPEHLPQPWQWLAVHAQVASPAWVVLGMYCSQQQSAYAI